MAIRTMDWATYLNQTVRIYRNLNNGTISVQGRVEGRWLVVGHVTACVLQDVQFTVRESGRQRVLRDQQKNVHAWAEGTLIAQAADIFAPVDLAYNPYENPTFVQRHTVTPITGCRYLVVRENRVFVSPDAVPIGSPAKPSPKPIAQLGLFTWAMAVA